MSILIDAESRCLCVRIAACNMEIKRVTVDWRGSLPGLVVFCRRT
ncbi:MAG: hypothetical protein ABI955_12625 [Nitrospirota bacterium]